MDIVGKFLAADDWPYSLVEGRAAYRTVFEGRNGQYTCYAQERADEEQFVFYSIFPERVSSERLADMAEFITRANDGMVIGNFEMDYADGEVRYKTSIDVEEVDLVEPLVRHLVYANVLTMERYSRGLASVISGRLSHSRRLKRWKVTKVIFRSAR
jgi:hypothetical protein